MIRIDLHSRFKRAYKKRIVHDSGLIKKVTERSKLFQDNPHHPLLRVHRLKGERDQYWSFSVSGDIRIVFQYLDDDQVLFVDIGSHNQVY